MESKTKNSQTKVDNVESKEQSILTNLQVTETKVKDDALTLSEDDAKVINDTKDEIRKTDVGVKIGGKTKQALFDLAKASGDTKILAFLESAKASGLISDGTRATSKSDSDGMIAIRKDFIKSCEKHSDGYNLKKNGTKEYYCIDLDNDIRIPRIYIKKPKDEKKDNDSTNT